MILSPTHNTPFRDQPPDEKASASPAKEDAPTQVTKEVPRTKGQLDPTEAQLLAQIIKRHTEGLPFQEVEFMAFGLSVFAEMAARYRGDFYKVIVGDSQLPVPTAFIKGACAAAVALRSSGPRQGKN
jgi:hypothetical protein